ncbi:MAG: protein kinase [Myxococcales bacterium]|nr:protein kinase [Myxococcales bacterium]
MTAVPTTPPNPTELGEFTVVGVLGEGGSATVYDARWGHRSVALKVIRADLAGAEARRFLDEARLLIDMAHPGVVKVLAAGTLPDGRSYLAMEKLPGQTLADRLGAGPIPLAQAIALFDQLCEAVAAMHAAGLIHRDLKPENVMLVQSDGALHAVLLDFGIAKAMRDGVVTLTETGQVRGTPAYMAPERFFGSPASVATDVYELAVTLFAMLAGRLPWDDTADPDVRLNPSRLAETVEVPGALDEEVARALSTRAANRPPDVLALRDRVRRAAGLGAAPPTRVTAPFELPLAPTVPTAVADRPIDRPTDRPNDPRQPWRQSGGAATTGSAASGERVEPAPKVAARTRRRWPLWAGGAVVAAGAAVIGVLVLGGDGTPGPARPDPWALSASGAVAPGSGNPEPLEPTPPAVARIALTAAKRDEIHAALGKVLAHHSPDATVVVALSVLEVRASAELSPVLLRAGESTTFTQLRMLMVGSCDLALGARGEWLSMAMVERPGALLKEYELIARGDWSRAEMEACFGQGRPGPVSRATAPGLPGEPITVVPTDGPPVLIGWLDEHTFYSTTSTADAAAIAARLTPRTGKPSALDQIGSRIDRQASAWLVGTRAALAAAVETPALTADVSVRLELDDAGLVGTVALYQPDGKRADATQAAVDAMIAKAKEDPILGLAIPALAVERDGTTVRMRGRMPVDLLAKAGVQMARALP